MFKHLVLVFLPVSSPTTAWKRGGGGGGKRKKVEEEEEETDIDQREHPSFVEPQGPCYDVEVNNNCHGQIDLLFLGPLPRFTVPGCLFLHSLSAGVWWSGSGAQGACSPRAKWEKVCKETSSQLLCHEPPSCPPPPHPPTFPEREKVAEKLHHNRWSLEAPVSLSLSLPPPPPSLPPREKGSKNSPTSVMSWTHHLPPPHPKWKKAAKKPHHNW